MQKQGFTIIEILISIMIIAILSATTLLIVANFIQKAKNETIKVELKSLSILAEQYYEEAGSYENVCTFLNKTISNINSKAGDNKPCHDYKVDRTDNYLCTVSHPWSFAVNLPNGEFWCVDSSKFFGKAQNITACQCTPVI